MRKKLFSIPILFWLSLVSLPARGDEFLVYLPCHQDICRVRDDGILVKEITVRRGDTLSGLSRRYSGKGHYFPQILLFNRIPHPDRIYTGDKLLVPVPAPRPSAARANRNPASVKQDSTSFFAQDKSLVQNEGVSLPERRLYKQGVSLLRKGRYRQALRLFSEFIEKFPESGLTPDAKLHHADCLLRLSRQ